MSTVTVNGTEITVQRFTLAKASRIITLLQILKKEVPEVSKAVGDFQRTYAKDYAQDLTRIQALARYGPRLEHITDAEWERAGQIFQIPGEPSTAEMFFELAPLIYEKAETVTLRLLGIIALDNDTVSRYVAQGDIWDRVDEFVDTTIKPAPLDELVELIVVAAEVIDGTILSKVRELGDRAGNVARLLGLKSSTPDPKESETLSEQPAQPNTFTAGDSPSSDGETPVESSDSPMTSSPTSPVSPTPSMTSVS